MFCLKYPKIYLTRASIHVFALIVSLGFQWSSKKQHFCLSAILSSCSKDSFKKGKKGIREYKKLTCKDDFSLCKDGLMNQNYTAENYVPGRRMKTH